MRRINIYTSKEDFEKISWIFCEKKQTIKFNIENDLPIKIETWFKSLNNSRGIIFLAQRRYQFKLERS